MNKYVIGIDPGSTKGHGVAVYVNGNLEDLHMMPLMKLHELLVGIKQYGSVIVHIEDVYGQKGNWHGTSQNKKAFAKAAQNTGLCKWAQVEVERMCEHIGVKVVKHKVSSKWKSQREKSMFEKLTGWNGRSNEDTRSAAWFGYLGLK